MKNLFNKYATKDNLIYVGVIFLVFLTVLSLVSFTPLLSASILTAVIGYLIHGGGYEIKIYKKKSSK